MGGPGIQNSLFPPLCLPSQGGAAAAASPPPAPATKATPYVMSTEELRRKNKQVGMEHLAFMPLERRKMWRMEAG